ncbi:MAG TPA: S41 family peptidase [Chthoniobacteraceae bacterium]|nr:S41 family peptidase [Chthoniobacteraceae bacterium]
MIAARVCRAATISIAALVLGAASAEAKSPTQNESDRAFTIFLNVKEELVERCIYRPSDMSVLTGALDALQHELDPEFAPYFPKKLSANFPKAWDEFQKTLRKLAALPELEKHTVKALVEQSLRAYCNKLDRYSGYDDRESWERELALKKTSYVGVGMSLERTREGFDCYPFPAGPADLAGCISGDRLLEVDGAPVRGRAAVDVGVMFPGPEHSVVQLKVRHVSDAKEEALSVKRERIDAAFIAVEQASAGATVRLRWFNDETVKELRGFLRTLRPGAPLTIDLRGCHGGELKAAIAVAELFLPAGAVICKIETRAGPEIFRSSNASPFRAKPLIILQDKGTMSGAELVTTVLVTSPDVRAESRGERSYGKGVTLSEVEVADGGGRLRFADGRIYGPHGEFWDGEGLSPTTEETRPK